MAAPSKILFALLSLGATLFLNPSFADAQTTRQPRFFVETDPSTFALGGYAAHLRIRVPHSHHLLAGAGVYALDLPQIMVDMNPENRNEGWAVRIRSAYGLFGEYYLREAGSRWYAGLQTSIQQYQISSTEVAAEGHRTFKNLLVMPSVGYVWKPFSFPLYLKPWAGIGFTTKIAGNNQIGNQAYEISSWVPFVTLHAGYAF